MQPYAVTALFAETLSALVSPRRAVPIALVAVPLLWAQYWFSGRSAVAVAVAIGVVLAFIATGPFTWRLLFGRWPPQTWAQWLSRGMVFTALGALPAVVMAGGVDRAWFGASFLTAGGNAAVISALFWVGGWGLGKDIELEHRLDTELRRVEALQREAERAQLLAIRAHLDPHFLFNTLNAIAEWCRQDGEVAERAILRLSGILREVLGGLNDDHWPLSRELELARDVWELHRLRDPAWFEVAWEVSPPVPDLGVPPMILLPLVENAVKHGPAKGHRGTLTLSLQTADDGVWVHVLNPGPYDGPRAGGQGVQLVQRRATLAYGERARVELGAHGDGVRASVFLAAGVPA